MTDIDAVALSPEEETRFRARLAASNGPDDDIGYAVFGDAQDAEEWAARLLATLDRERARKRAVADRFAAKVDKLGDCWLWTGAVNDTGYGLFRTSDGGHAGHPSLAHRYAFAQAHPEIALDASQIVMHTCDNAACVRAEHLRLGTHAENIADKVAKGRARTPSGQDNGRSGTGRRMADRIRQLEAALAVARADRDGLREAALELLYALDGLGPMGIRNAKHALRSALTAEARTR